MTPMRGGAQFAGIISGICAMAYAKGDAAGGVDEAVRPPAPRLPPPARPRRPRLCGRRG
jgi:hypothetical protein